MAACDHGLLAPRRIWSFQELKAELKMSDGNLITHMRTLHKQGLVSVTKEFRGRPQTTYALTAKGRVRFGSTSTRWRKIVKEWKS